MLTKRPFSIRNEEISEKEVRRMKRTILKPIVSVALIFVLVVALSLSAYAAVMFYTSVDLAANQTNAVSSTFSAKECYISSTTHNNSVSTQDMRVQFHYKSGLSWVYDVRKFLAPGASASTTYSSYFLNDHTWRLGLSPKVESAKGVSGSGRAYYS